MLIFFRYSTSSVETEDKNGALQECENGNLNNLGHNLGSMLESAINCQPETVTNNEGTFSPSDNVLLDSDSQSSVAASDRIEVEKNTLCDVNFRETAVQRFSDSDDHSSDVLGSVDSLELSNLSSSNLHCETSDEVKVAADSPCWLPCDAVVDRGNVDISEDVAEDVRLLQVGDQPKSFVDDVNTIEEKYCDILNSRKRNESSESYGADGGGGSSYGDSVVDELVMRLSGTDVSVQTSVETIVGNNFCGEATVGHDLHEHK